MPKSRYEVEIILNKGFMDPNLDGPFRMEKPMVKLLFYEEYLPNRVKAYSLFAEKIVKYFAKYRKGALTPNYFGRLNRVDRPFNINNLSDIVYMLSIGKSIQFARKDIEGINYKAEFFEKRIYFSFPIQTRLGCPDMEFIERMIEDFVAKTEAKYGQLIHDNKVLYQVNKYKWEK